MSTLSVYADSMSGDVCHSYLRNKEAIELRGFGGAKTFASAEVCDVTVTTAYHARWMVHVQRAFIMDCRVKVAVYDTTIGDIRLQPVVSTWCTVCLSSSREAYLSL